LTFFSIVFVPSDAPSGETTPQTIESITAERRRRLDAEQKAKDAAEKKAKAAADKATKEAAKKLSDDQKDSDESSEKSEESSAAASPTDPAALEQQAGQQGAFNPETGEINWDCPCLGGMAHGPCGEQFKAAFSCFIFSEEDPKGVDCIDHFK
jgi:intermembrane space import and assembly protein 40